MPYVQHTLALRRNVSASHRLLLISNLSHFLACSGDFTDPEPPVVGPRCRRAGRLLSTGSSGL